MKILISCRTYRNPNGFDFDKYETGFNDMFPNDHITALLNKNQDYKFLADNHDLLVLSGGNDEQRRLVTEIEMINQFNIRKKPILGVCHGAFLLTQLMDGEIVHPLSNHKNTFHSIFYNNEDILVNSYHGSGIVKEPTGAKILAKDENGLIESWIFENILAVVWHPERQPNHWMPNEFKELINNN